MIKKNETAWVLSKGRYFNKFNDGGKIICVSKTRKKLIEWIKQKYPKHKRVKWINEKDEIYLEDDKSQSWIRCRIIDKCPLI